MEGTDIAAVTIRHNEKERKIWTILLWLKQADILVAYEDEDEIFLNCAVDDARKICAYIGEVDDMPKTSKRVVLKFRGKSLERGKQLMQHKRDLESGNYDAAYARLMSFEKMGFLVHLD